MLQIDEWYMNIPRSWARGQIASHQCVHFSLCVMILPKKLRQQAGRKPQTLWITPMPSIPRSWMPCPCCQSACESITGFKVTQLLLNKALCCLRIFTARPQMSLQVTLVARQSILTLKIQGKVSFCVFCSWILVLLLKTSHNRRGWLLFLVLFPQVLDEM